MKIVFGETAKLFEAIDENAFKDKIEDAMKQMENLFNSNNFDEKTFDKETFNKDLSGINFDNLPKAEEIHSHINSLMEGKLGKLAQEIANDTASELDIDPTNINSMNDVFKNLFKDPKKLINIVGNVGKKLDEKLKSGDIKESEILEEATSMMDKMKNIPGMNNIEDLLKKFNLPNMPNGSKINTGAFKKAMADNTKMSKMKERMNAKLNEKKNNLNSSDIDLSTLNSNLNDLIKNMNNNVINNNVNNNNVNNNNVNNNNEKKEKSQKRKKKIKGIKK